MDVISDRSGSGGRRTPRRDGPNDDDDLYGSPRSDRDRPRSGGGSDYETPGRLRHARQLENPSYSKKLKTRLDGFTREKSQKAYLRQQIERLEAQNNNLRKRDVGDIANAVENRMEGFLNVLADSLHPDDYETPGRGSRGAISVPKGHLPPSRASSENIIGWLHDKKRKQGLSSKRQPHFTDSAVREAMVWCIRTLQDEVADREGYVRDRQVPDYGSDGGSE